jgi:hypothetical protein
MTWAQQGNPETESRLEAAPAAGRTDGEWLLMDMGFHFLDNEN